MQEQTKSPYEDRALKAAMAYFGQQILTNLNIDEKIERVLSAEEITLIMKQSLMDYNFLSSQNRILHFEFQSSPVGEAELRRFRRYEVSLSDYYNMDVITYVICTGNIKEPLSELQNGINVYRVIPVIMNDQDADETFSHIHKKLTKSQRLTRTDLTSLLLTPLMGGKLSIADRIMDSIKILRQQANLEVDANELQTMEAILYVFASKFLTKSELNQVKEVIKMTPLGELLYADGYAEGESRGRLLGEARGEARGELQGQQNVIFSILSDLGAIPKHLAATMEKEHDLETIKKWIRIALQSKNIEDFEERM